MTDSNHAAPIHSALGLTPERRFLYYAWPCLDGRHGHGQVVSEQHLTEIRTLLTTRDNPRRALLRYVFPDAYRGITQAGMRLHVAKWSHAAIQHYFLVEHDRHLDAALTRGVPRAIINLCRVYLARVTRLVPLECISLTTSDSSKMLVNPLRIPLVLGVVIAVHGLAVVDLFENTLVAEAS